MTLRIVGAGKSKIPRIGQQTGNSDSCLCCKLESTFLRVGKQAGNQAGFLYYSSEAEFIFPMETSVFPLKVFS